MKVRIHVRDTVTGLTGVKEWGWDYAEHGLRYYFGAGNYSCDDNRSYLLIDANPAYDEELGCNAGPNRIAVDKIEDEHGRVIYTDAEHLEKSR
jgi:hypothetical protein